MNQRPRKGKGIIIDEFIISLYLSFLIESERDKKSARQESTAKKIANQQQPSNKTPRLRVLLIEDNPGDARLIKEMLLEFSSLQFELVHAERLSDGLRRLGEEQFEVILLDLLLPDGTGFDTFSRTYSQVPEIPIICLTGLDSQALGSKTVREGAQDYLVKGQFDRNQLIRSILFAIERHQINRELNDMALVDELTCLYNRRGFLILAEQNLKLGSRNRRPVSVFFVDMDGLKEINDCFGHSEGDSALIEISAVLKKTFRDSDIIARIGGDEFVILAMGTGEKEAEIITARLQEYLNTHNARENRSYKLSLSVGSFSQSWECPFSIHEMISRADSHMYEQKIRKKIRKGE